jgi:2'-5' RNA ligase
MDRRKIKDDKYWIGICPPPNVVDYVNVYKLDLKEKIGWYHSVNSKAHITFFEFFNASAKLEAIEKYLIEFCSNLKAFEVHLNKAGHYHNAYCLFPEDTSKEILVPIMKQFQRGKPFQPDGKSVDPHMSIARLLTSEQMNAAIELFGSRTFDTRFICANLTIRKFNPDIGQYEIYKRFEFGKAADSLLF